MMALLLKFPLSPSTRSGGFHHGAVSSTRPSLISFHPRYAVTSNSRGNTRFLAVEESKESEKETEEADPVPVPVEESIGAEIKEVRKDGKEGDLLAGVAAEVREIEWPAFHKVLGTTGVVIGVIFGSSVVLLTVNALLAELSDRVFAGRGVQDFFT